MLRSIALALALAVLLLPTPPASAAPRNIVFILIDDLGYMDIGANNPGTFYETPNVDRIAAEGARFTQGYAANPVCGILQQPGRLSRRRGARGRLQARRAIRGRTGPPLQHHGRYDDIGEQTDLAESMPERVNAMRRKLHAWYREVDAKFLRAKEAGGPQPWRP